MNRLITIATTLLLLFCACISEKKETAEDTNLYRIMVGDKYGFIDYQGNIVIEPQYNYANTLFSEEGLCFVATDDRRGFIDKTGTFVVELGDSVKFTVGNDFIDGMIAVCCFDSIGYSGIGIINKQGEFVVNPELECPVRLLNDDKTVYLAVDGNGSRSIFSLGNNNTDNYGLIQYDSVLGTYSGQGGAFRNIAGSEYDSVTEFHNGRCAVEQNGKWGYIDNNGVLIINAVYDSVRPFTEDSIALVKNDKKYKYIGYSGKVILEVDSALTDFHYGRAIAFKDGRKALINKSGQKVYDINADKVYGFNIEDALATLVKNGNAFKIDTNGKTLLQTKYDYIGAFIGGVAPVSKGDKWGFIDTTGTEIISVSYDKYDENTHSQKHKVRSVIKMINDKPCYSYYDLRGNLIWQDIPPVMKFNPDDRFTFKKDDYLEYFRSNLSTLDPIEGLYYVTLHDIYVDRDNPNKMGSNGTKSKIYAIIRTPGTSEFICYWVDDEDPGWRWRKKFVRLGEGNTYAVTNVDPDKSYGDDTRLVLDNPYKFEIPIETGRNNWYNFYCNYDFVKDYPPASEYEQVMQPEWSGSGFAIADGLIATNYHVINGAKHIAIKGVDGEIETAYNGYVLASDKEHDIAIIKIVDKNFKGFGKIPYSVGKSIADVGEDVYALGYPLTTTMGNEIKLTNGIISSISGFQGDMSMYQISVPIQPGNSGGPLFDANGNVIGIVMAKHAEAENANYAVKINYLASLIANNHLDIKLADSNKTKGKSLKKQVKMVKDFVYLIECRN